MRNCFPHKGYLWNYGAFPQTWEDPNVVHPETKAKGDNDPLDVCEIGELVGYTGQVKQVKVLGVMALLDEEETDWKVIVIDVNDPLASKLNDVEDVERHLPGLLRATNEWFRIYKIPDGKPENQFAFTGECKNKDYAMDVIRECSEAWEKLMTGKTPSGGISTYVVSCVVSMNPFADACIAPTSRSTTRPAKWASRSCRRCPRTRTSPLLRSTARSTSGSSSAVPRPRKAWCLKTDWEFDGPQRTCSMAKDRVMELRVFSPAHTTHRYNQAKQVLLGRHCGNGRAGEVGDLLGGEVTGERSGCIALSGLLGRLARRMPSEEFRVSSPRPVAEK